MGWVSITIDVETDRAEALADALLEQGALSVDVSDAQAGSPHERAIFDEPDEPAHAHWQLNRVCALFDADVDREQGLHSWVTRFGEVGAFTGARILHLITIVLLIAVGLGVSVGLLYWVGVVIVGALLLYEHTLVRPGDLRRLDAAFFTMNGVISVAFFAFVLADVL